MRREIFQTLELTAQRADAAEVLWSTGHAAEALRLAADAFGVANTLPTDDATLRSLGAGPADLQAIDRAASRMDDSILPTRDDEALEVAADFYVELRAGSQILARLHRPCSIGATGVLRERFWRTSVILALLFALLAFIVFLGTRPPGPQVTASGEFPDARFAAANAFDGNRSTEWLLPDRTMGWVMKRFPSPQDVTGIRVMNGRNQAFGDRAVRAFVVQLLRDDDVVAEQAGLFAAVEERPEWVDVAVSGHGITAVRFKVEGYHQLGAALAEIDVKTN